MYTLGKQRSQNYIVVGGVYVKSTNMDINGNTTFKTTKLVWTPVILNSSKPETSDANGHRDLCMGT